jgi:DNA-binding NarL/FixJ family response regulator
MLASGDPLKVLIVDDHASIRRGIESLINTEWPRMRCVGAVATAVDALRHAEDRQPGVVVVDADLDGEDGLALIPLLRRKSACRVLVLTSLQDARVASRALRLGADACLHKTAPASDLLACIAGATGTPEHAPTIAGSGTAHVEQDHSPRASRT